MSHKIRETLATFSFMFSPYIPSMYIMKTLDHAVVLSAITHVVLCSTLLSFDEVVMGMKMVIIYLTLISIDS